MSIFARKDYRSPIRHWLQVCGCAKHGKIKKNYILLEDKQISKKRQITNTSSRPLESKERVQREDPISSLNGLTETAIFKNNIDFCRATATLLSWLRPRLLEVTPEGSCQSHSVEYKPGQLELAVAHTGPIPGKGQQLGQKIAWQYINQLSLPGQALNLTPHCVVLVRFTV